MLEQIRHLAGYNAWANQRLYEAVLSLEEEQQWRDLGLFFRSLGGTLNHILVADRVWMKRFTGEGEHPDKLTSSSTATSPSSGGSATPKIPASSPMPRASPTRACRRPSPIA